MGLATGWPGDRGRRRLCPMLQGFRGRRRDSTPDRERLHREGLCEPLGLVGPALGMLVWHSTVAAIGGVRLLAWNRAAS